MRTSCREGGYVGLSGYFRGVREFFPQGSFEETRLTHVSLDPTWCGSNGVQEVYTQIGIVKRKLRELKSDEKYMRDTLKEKESYRISSETREYYRQELKKMPKVFLSLKKELEDLITLLG